MVWTTTPAGSWSVSKTDTPSDMAAALALPQSWRIGMQNALFVRADQVANLSAGSLKTGYLAWYDASQITGVADGAALTTWNDSSSPSNFPLTQGTPGNRPTYYKTTGAQLINGRPAVVFNGTSSYLLSSSSTIPGNAPMVIHMVLVDPPTASSQTTFMHGTNTVAGLSNSTTWRGTMGGTAITGGTPDSNAHVVTWQMNTSGTSTIRVDQLQVATGSNIAGSPAAIGNLSLGASVTGTNFAGCRIGEVAFYPASSITAADVTANEQYLAAKWGTPTPPTAPFAGYTAWYDASQITGVADGAALASWPDLSSNHYDMTQGTGANRPTYYKTTGAQLQNGKPVVVFAGAPQYLNSGAANLPIGAVPVMQGVFKTTNAAATAVIFQIASGPNFFINGSVWWANAGATTISGGVPDTAMHQLTAYVIKAGTAVLRLDGAQIATGTNIGGGTAAAQGWLGGGPGPTNYWPGTVCEFIYYANFTGTATDYQTNETYLKAKWGTP